MPNPKFEMVYVAKSAGTRKKIEQLRRMLTLSSGGDPVPLFEAIDVAITNELKRRKAKP